MEIALSLAKQGQTTCMPNPMVGCVVVKNDVIVGRGAHLKTGGPHAEVVALEEAGAEASKGAHVYVTLEPCSHVGRTPPCADFLIRSQVKVVHIAMEDPNPLVAGRGIEKLRQAGIEVHVGSHAAQAVALNKCFLHYMKFKMPYVIAKWAMTLDGKMATHTGHSQWITSEAARFHVHELRSEVSAVAVGAQTLLRDNPLLNVRHVQTSRQPRPIIFGSPKVKDSNFNVFYHGCAPIYLHTSHSLPDFIKKLQDKGVECICVDENSGNICLRSALKELAHREISSILLEGGSRLLTSFFSQKLINHFAVYIAPRVLGGKMSLSPITGLSPDFISDALALEDVKWQQVGSDFVVRGEVPTQYCDF